MIVSARPAVASDLAALAQLYGGLEAEMTEVHPMWPLADGLGDPLENAWRLLLDDPDTVIVIGEIDGYPFGFLVARIEDLLPRAAGERVGSIRLVFVDPPARQVGVGEAMLDLVLGQLRSRSISKFDAHVLPGHRLVKNFFESGGFSARSIVMHHDDER